MSDIIVPSSPADQKKLREGINEIVESMFRSQSEREYQKEAISELSETFEIDAKHIRRMATDAFKDSFDKKAKEFDEYATLYETIMIIKNPTNDNDQDEE